MSDKPAEPQKLGTYADIKQKVSTTTWLWEKRIPFGHVTAVCGPPGVSKSKLAIEIARHCLNGEKWPGGALCVRMDKIMICDTEGSQAITLERLEAAGMSLDRVVVPFSPEEALSEINLSNPASWAKFQKAVIDHKPRLIIIDSLRGAYSGKEKESEDTQAVMKRLQLLARDIGCAIVIIHHVRKSQGRRRCLALDDARGSGTIIANVRSLFMVENFDPEDENSTRTMRQKKNNLAPLQDGLAFEPNDKGIEWVPWPMLEKPRSNTDDAIDFLKDALASGPMEAGEVAALAHEALITPSALKDAKRILRVQSKKDPGKGGPWRWHLPKRADA